MRWFQDIKNILADESETWLAYLHGQQLHNRPLLTQKQPRFRGLLLQVVRYAALILRDLRLKQHPDLKRPAKFFVFAGTTNQMGALDQAIDALKMRGENLVAVGNSRMLTSQGHAESYVPYQLTLGDAARSLVLLSARGVNLYRLLRTRHPAALRWYFADFCSAFTWLAYFYRVLIQVKPEFVITANDHNVANRCMLAVAHHMGIKTVYLQHASVSPIFPALRVNYAFLDGQCALDTYRQCEPNQPDTARAVPIPHVVLSGQKKHLRRSDNTNKDVVGVALNALDNAEAGIQFIDALVDNGLNVLLRWHPGLTDRDTARYRDAYAGSQRVTLSDPRQKPVSDFLEQISWLVAGNSSIHLEAALVGIMPIYYELTPADQPDYYGYVKHGLAQPAESVGEVLELVERSQEDHAPNCEAVRYYSATYLTQWESREGDLVAECLQRLSKGEELPVEVTDFELKGTEVFGASVTPHVAQ